MSFRQRLPSDVWRMLLISYGPRYLDLIKYREEMDFFEDILLDEKFWLQVLKRDFPTLFVMKEEEDTQPLEVNNGSTNIVCKLSEYLSYHDIYYLFSTFKVFQVNVLSMEVDFWCNIHYMRSFVILEQDQLASLPNLGTILDILMKVPILACALVTNISDIKIFEYLYENYFDIRKHLLLSAWIRDSERLDYYILHRLGKIKFFTYQDIRSIPRYFRYFDTDKNRYTFLRILSEEIQQVLFNISEPSPIALELLS